MRRGRCLTCLVVSTTLLAWGVTGAVPAAAARWRAAPAGAPAPAASRQPVRAERGMVVAVEPLAAEIGADILRQGGNAVDAAVAVGFALAVTHPSAGNLGGGGFMLIRLADGRAVAIDYRETAPARATPTMYLDPRLPPDASTVGHLAAGVPGTVDGLITALEKYGTMSLPRVIRPAIDLAGRGIVVDRRIAEGLRAVSRDLARFPSSARVFLKPHGELYAEGDLLVQEDLAATLKRIARHGREGFYGGETADLIARDMAANGGIITREDLAGYQAIIRKPVRGSYRGFEILSMPPPSSGGVALIEMLNILEGYDLGAPGFGSGRGLRLMVEAMRRAYADRAQFLGDADFSAVPVDRLISKGHARELRSTIDTLRATPSRTPEPAPGGVEGTHTTHYSVVDGQGNAVANTYTINDWYGSRAVVAGAGFLLNDEMDDFNTKPGVTNARGRIGTAPNLIAPGKRMLSSMTPTIVVRDGRPYLITGSPGGRTIINTVLQVILNVIDHRMDIQAAVDAPRIDHEWFPDLVRMEPGFAPAEIQALRMGGYTVSAGITATGDTYVQGDAHSILVDPDTGVLLGAPDRRRLGAAAGY